VKAREKAVTSGFRVGRGGAGELEVGAAEVGLLG
jgi:hypothetical protein